MGHMELMKLINSGESTSFPGGFYSWKTIEELEKENERLGGKLSNLENEKFELGARDDETRRELEFRLKDLEQVKCPLLPPKEQLLWIDLPDYIYDTLVWLIDAVTPQ